MEAEQEQALPHMQTPGADDNKNKVHLAMGGDVQQCLLSLRWALRNVPRNFTLVLVHVYRQATRIPTRFGALMPVSMLREQIVSAYKTEERENIDTYLEMYIKICTREKVQAETLIAENDDVAAGLMDLIKQCQITILIMGSVRNRINGLKSKLSTTLEKQADPSCNILFLRNGNLISIVYLCMGILKSPANNVSEIVIACKHRHEDDSAYMIGTYDLPSFGSFHHLSSGSTYTSSTLSSFFRDSCSTGSGLDITRLDDTVLEDTAPIFDDTRFSDIFGHVSIGAFKEVAASHPNLADQSQELHQAFHTKCIEVLTRCQFAGGTESVLGVDCKGLEGEQWRIIKSWPAALEYIVRVLNAALMQPKQNRVAKVLNTLQLQLLKQNSRTCSMFTTNNVSEAAKEPVRLLLNLASQVAKVKKSPDKLFCVLYMHRALYDAIPTLSRVFGEEFVKKETEGVFAALKDSSLEIIRELKVLVQTYSPKKVPMEGCILTVTGYLMKYIRLLVNHIGSLDMILCTSQDNDLLTIEGVNPTGRLATGLIADLESVLKEKSSIYASEPGLQYLFLMNNAHFILQEVEESDVRLMVGAEWIKKRCYHIEQYKTDYLSSSWKQVVHHLETATSTSPPQEAQEQLPQDLLLHSQFPQEL
ncbi:exocyst complex component EXO70B1-like [Miscanthus floridulus]|uniref:exocyst complex component EXO70B1-like n=1 Tax=Miscanthus floridulus TaxID=154761 RepID=UPI003458A6D5